MMRSNRRRNWFIKRFALGLAIAAVAAPVAQAKIDEGSSVQANGYQSFVTDFPSSSAVSTSSNQIELVRVEQPRSTPSEVALAAGNQIELVRVEQPRSTNALAKGDQIEVVRRTSERQPDRQDRVRSHATPVDRRAAGRLCRLRLEGRWDRRGPRSRARPPRRRSGARKPPRRSRADRLAHPNRAAHIVSGPHGPLTAALANGCRSQRFFEPGPSRSRSA